MTEFGHAGAVCHRLGAAQHRYTAKLLGTCRTVVAFAVALSALAGLAGC